MDRGSFSPEELTEFVNLMQVYEGAMYEISTKLEILDSEFQVRFSHDPIHHMERRLKSVNSILGKLKRRTLPVTVSSIKDNLFDVAGIRVICYFLDDIYDVARWLSSQDDIRLLQVKDYIKNPKPNGYRSYHMIIEIPVFFAEGKTPIRAEIQIRTIGMDFWASLEHQLRYKKDLGNNEQYALITQKLTECARTITATDNQMQDIKNLIGEYCEF